ncbi:uncharacterized protein LOC135198254 [Macrobrachium nipponense]|uniref:uncharacterized protein LOC135198254 n=1 Tax=Macrobrachium nipponense TaxID=159736 RepID=UPI0030C7AE17
MLDVRHTVDNLVKGSGSWLSSASDRSGRLQADLQLEKAIKISFLDLGNSSSATISVEVGRSSWPTSQPLVTLLPTVVLMTPAEWRSGKNMTAVRMFKQCDFNAEATEEKWDKVRIVCTQPYRKDVQFGLSLFRLHTNSEVLSVVEDPVVNTNKDDTKIRKVADMKKEELVSRMNLPAVKKKTISQSIGWLENKILTNGEEAVAGPPCNPFTSPVSRAAQLLVMAAKPQSKQEVLNEKANLECEALEFLIGLSLTIEDINTLKVSGVRREFEKSRQKELSPEERRIFKDIALDFAKERLKRLEIHHEKIPMKGVTKNISQHKNEGLIKSKEMRTTVGMKTYGIMTVDSKMKETKDIKEDKSQSYHFSNIKEKRIQGPKKKFTFKHIDSLGKSEKSNHVSESSVSLSRQKLREEDDLEFRSSSASPRNSVALGDSRVITPKRSWNGKAKSHLQETKTNLQMNIDGWFTKSKRMKDDISSLHLSVGGGTISNDQVSGTKDHSYNKVDSGGGFLVDPTPYVIKNSASDSSVLDSGTCYTLGSAPANKFNIGHYEASTHTMVECPLCSGLFDATKIEGHAASCGIISSDSDMTDIENDVSAVNHKEDKEAMDECPVCGDFIVSTSLEDHTTACVASSFPD